MKKENEKKKYIRLSAQDVRILLRDLNVLVVSLDRLGSTFHDNPKRHAIEVDKFLSDVFAFRMLAKARRVLLEAYESESNKAEMKRLEGWLEKVKVWPQSRRARH